MIDGLLEGLRERGYVEGQTILIEYRFSEDRNDQLPALAAELVARKVDLIVASGTPASFAAKNATNTIPIVMGGIAADPVETGLVASLAHPGGNITGMSRLQRVEVRAPDDFDGAFEAATRMRAGALIAPGDPLVANRPKMLADLALKHRMPVIMDNKEFVEAGGFLSLGPDLVDSYRRAATHVDKILKGAKPGDLPMEQPTKFDVAINLKTADALGLTIPPSVLTQATRVIQ